MRGPYFRFRPPSFFGDPGPQPLSDEAQDSPVRDAMLDEFDQPFVRQMVERTLDTLPTVTSMAIPSRCGVIRPRHPLEGQALAVLGWSHRQGQLHLLLGITRWQPLIDTCFLD